MEVCICLTSVARPVCEKVFCGFLKVKCPLRSKNYMLVCYPKGGIATLINIFISTISTKWQVVKVSKELSL